MFRSKKLAVAEANEMHWLTVAVSMHLCQEVEKVRTELLERTSNASERELIVKNSMHVLAGMEMVLVNEVSPFSPELKAQNQPTQCGALLANGTRNTSMLTGKLKHSDCRSDIVHAITLQN